MEFEVGEIYNRLDITSKYGYKPDKQSMRGGLFHRNDTVILIKDESKRKTSSYPDEWDPYRPGTLLYFATLKGPGINNGPEKPLNISTGANYHLYKGDCDIVLFTKNGDNYRYMGKFKRTDREPVYGKKHLNGYDVPAFELESVNPSLIIEYIDEHLENNHDINWGDSEVKEFLKLYNPECTDHDDLRNIAIILHRPVNQIRSLINAIEGNNDGSISPQLLSRIKEMSCVIENEELNIEGGDVERNVKVRFGQNIFRNNLERVFKGECCITGIKRRELLRASHVYPWKYSDSFEKVNPNNGLLLNAFHDALFDKFLMTVRADGTVEYLDSLKDTLGPVYDKNCKPFIR